MTVCVVVGGQYGSEGKGKVIAARVKRMTAPVAVRCGGPNSGHNIELNGKDMAVRQIPSGIVHPDSTLVLSAGCVLDIPRFIEECKHFEVERTRLFVDPMCVVVTEEDRELERKTLVDSVGSTASGTGMALARRSLRQSGCKLARDFARELAPYCNLADVSSLLARHRRHGSGDVIIEGTQGFGLSLLHGGHWPQCTSRDTTAAQYVMEAGISPLHVDEVIVCVRTWPIRVGGNSGPLYRETTWDEVSRACGAPEAEPELTSVTRRLRRVGHFDVSLVRRACEVNGATGLAVMGIDRNRHENRGCREYNKLEVISRSWLINLEGELGVPVQYVGTGPKQDDIIETEFGIAMAERDYMTTQMPQAK